MSGIHHRVPKPEEVEALAFACAAATQEHRVLEAELLREESEQAKAIREHAERCALAETRRNTARERARVLASMMASVANLKATATTRTCQVGDRLTQVILCFERKTDMTNRAATEPTEVDINFGPPKPWDEL